MNDNDTTHVHLSRALLAGVLDFPAALDTPDIAKVQAGDLHPGFSELWSKVRELQRQNNLSVTTLSASIAGVGGFTVPYLNQLRAEYRDMSFEDLKGISESLRDHAQKRDLDGLASYIAAQARSPQKAKDIAKDVIKQLTPIALSGGHTFTLLGETLSKVYEEIETRYKNPVDIWGIPYKYYPKLSQATGGKQKGELTLFVGEPKIGKTWFILQDAMGTALDNTPVAFWSGEMKKEHIVRRMLQIMGMDGRRMKTGRMLEGDWPILTNAVEHLENAPFYLDTSRLHINDVRAVATRLKNEFGVEYMVFDYAYLIGAQGKDEIEKTGNVSSEIKSVALDLDVAITLITSVNKVGMDTSGAGDKKNVRGSGQQIHDADNVFIFTKFAPVDDSDKLRVLPSEYEQLTTLHLAAGRELDSSVPGGCIHYRRLNSPKFEEQR